MKRMTLMMAAVAVLAVGSVLPASAQVVREQVCTTDDGMTYDCAFNVKGYVTGSPVTLTIGYSCEGTCGTVTSFGISDDGWMPAGTTGHMVGGRRVPDGLELTFVFDSLKKTGNGGVGNARFVMTMMKPDDQGGLMVVQYPVDVHLKDSSESPAAEKKKQ